MKIGFTGAQVGMTKAQKVEFQEIIQSLPQKISEFHHGDCIGADADAHNIICELREKDKKFAPVIHVHPPIKTNKRAFCKLGPLDIEWISEEYLERNHLIVDASDILIATPKEYYEVLRSGTWATIRYARNYKTHIIIYPDGASK